MPIVERIGQLTDSGLKQAIGEVIDEMNKRGWTTKQIRSVVESVFLTKFMEDK